MLAIYSREAVAVSTPIGDAGRGKWMGPANVVSAIQLAGAEIGSHGHQRRSHKAMAAAVVATGGAGGDGSGMSAWYLALLLMVLFACCLMTNLLGVFAIFGAFLLGVALHEELSLVKAWRDQFMGLVLVALVPIFFTNTGLHTEIGVLKTPAAWLGFSLVMLMAVAGKLGGCYLGARYTGQPVRESACVAALMNTRALMGLVAINVGLDLGLLTRELFTMFVIMALLTTAMTEPLLRWWLPRQLRAHVDEADAHHRARERSQRQLESDRAL
jgi:Sodium/hydrogen exchanger family